MTTATGANYSIYLRTSTGQLLAVIDRWTELEYSLVVNDVGALRLTLPTGERVPGTALPDGQLEVWRRPPGRQEYRDADQVWFIQAVTQTRARNGERSTVIEAVSGLWLLQEPGRFIDAYAESSGALKTGAADDVIKALVRENATSAALSLGVAAPTRAYPGLIVAANAGQAPSITRACAWDGVLSTIQSIAKTSTEAGTYLAFDLTADASGLTFATYIQQRGTDRRFPGGVAPVIFGSDYGNLAETSLRLDYRDEVNWVRAGGQGDGVGRLTGTDEDTTRSTVSPYRRREAFRDATRYTTTTGLTNEAQAEVRAGRPRVVFSGKIQTTPDTQYGVHWQWGDYVTVQEFGYQIDARIDAVVVRVSPDREEITAVIRAEQYA